MKTLKTYEEVTPSGKRLRVTIETDCVKLSSSHWNSIHRMITEALGYVGKKWGESFRDSPYISQGNSNDLGW